MTERRSDAPRLEARGATPVAANRGKARAGRAARSAEVARCTRTSQDNLTSSSSETLLKRLVSARGAGSESPEHGTRLLVEDVEPNVFVCSEELLAGCARREDQSGGEGAGTYVVKCQNEVIGDGSAKATLRLTTAPVWTREARSRMLLQTTIILRTFRQPTLAQLLE